MSGHAGKLKIKSATRESERRSAPSQPVRTAGAKAEHPLAALQHGAGNAAVTDLANRGAAPPAEQPPLTDDDLLKLADQSPIVVEGKAPHQFDDLISAARRGLIDLTTPAEFERQMRFRISRGSTEYADSWTSDERWNYALAETGDEKAAIARDKWDSYVQQTYMAYMRQRAAEWEDACERMDRAARVGNAIAKYTIETVVALPTLGGAYIDLGGVELGKRLLFGKVLAASTSTGDDTGWGAVVDIAGSSMPSKFGSAPAVDPLAAPPADPVVQPKPATPELPAPATQAKPSVSADTAAAKPPVAARSEASLGEQAASGG
ncbi:MAG: hypothetical protein JSR21_22035, partial [Proteobacteria bacterium]|nr:hypothetical protein [Pseudomonadota bacterium]